MSSDLIWAVVRLLVALPLVLGLAFLLLRYGLARRYVTTPGNRRMKLVEQLPLGPKTILSLVALGERYYLLAHQDNAVNLIKELNELPVPEGLTAGDIVELTPRPIEEFYRGQKPGGNNDAGRLPDTLKKRGLHLKELAGRTARAKEILTARLAALHSRRLLDAGHQKKDVKAD
ncbi:MAG: Flagellar biosynthesis protein, FliO [Pelotomaculum sp. PtaU1.Bin035]|nr:MAG: Flagellar biosynthesis protein, FliO [Pelotomaculum sp. PtaU1.Bin035]